VSPPRAAAPYCRTPLVRLDGVMSSYDADGETGSAWADRVDLAAKSTGWGTEAIRLATRNAQASVLAAGGTMGVTDCYRSFRASARRKASARNPRNVASPGRSNHNAGCAIDIDAYHLGGISMEELHAIVKPLGFSPFRDDYLMKSECWHFDFSASGPTPRVDASEPPPEHTQPDRPVHDPRRGRVGLRGGRGLGR